MAVKKPVRTPHLSSRFTLHNLGRYLLRGILVLAPILITASALVWSFNRADSLLHPYVTMPGLGLACTLLFITLVGWISTFRFLKRIFGMVDHTLEHTPGVSLIYVSVRDFFEAFVGHKRRFTHPVLVNVLADDVWLAGFLTDENPASFNLGTSYVSVYVPQAYNVGGQLYLVPRQRVRPIENIAPTNVMKYAVTGGAVEIVPLDP